MSKKTTGFVEKVTKEFEGESVPTQLSGRYQKLERDLQKKNVDTKTVFEQAFKNLTDTALTKAMRRFGTILFLKHVLGVENSVDRKAFCDKAVIEDVEIENLSKPDNALLCLDLLGQKTPQFQIRKLDLKCLFKESKLITPRFQVALMGLTVFRKLNDTEILLINVYSYIDGMGEEKKKKINNSERNHKRAGY